MTHKELILQALDRVPESELPNVLIYLEKLQPPVQKETDDEFLGIYAQLVEKRKEVYQRLADS
jgi:hypothetical protein